jgi:S-adenosylmethionine/arginine decarboxylase-like enzyme
MHVAVDFARDPLEAQKLWAPDTVRRYLKEAVKATGLTRFGPEVVEENGTILMGFQMVAESHVSVHADRASGWGWADVFSCKDVSDLKIEAVVRECFIGTDPSGWLFIRPIPRMELTERGADAD